MNIRNLELYDDEGYLGWLTSAHFEHLGVFNQVGLDRQDGVGDVEIDISNYPGGDAPTEAQWKALEYFAQNQKRVLEAICQGVLDEKDELIDIYDKYDEEWEEGIPDWKTLEDVNKSISISSIYVLGDEKDGYAYVGYSGGCSWDGEHGFGVMTHKDRIIIVGAWSDASSGSKEIHKDNDTYTEEMRLEDEAWELQRLENIERYKREQLAMKEGDIRKMEPNWTGYDRLETEFTFDELIQFRKDGSKANEEEEGLMDICFDGSSKEKPSEAEWMALEYFNEHQKEILENLCLTVFSAKASYKKVYGNTFPKLDKPEDVCKYINPTQLYVVGSHVKDGYAFLGIGAECDWSDEQHFGAMTYKGKILAIGGWETATKVSDKMLNPSETSMEKQIENKKPWWKFW